MAASFRLGLRKSERALAYFNGLEADQQNGSGLKWGAISGLAQVDRNLAVQFAMDRQQAGDRDATRLVDYLAREVIRTSDAANAANWASTLPAGTMQDAAVRRVAEEYAEENPAAALSWANTLPEGNGRNRAMRETFSEWAREDPQTAATRLSSLPESPERDSATYGYATRVAWEDPVAGIEWANTIGDGATRNRAIMDTGRAFFRRDPETARRWLQQRSTKNNNGNFLPERGRGWRGLFKPRGHRSQGADQVFQSFPTFRITLESGQCLVNRLESEKSQE